MLKISFATHNSRKLGEARAACADFDIEVEQVKLEIDEIQHHDSLEISEHKASEAYRLVKKPVVITDTSWNIPALNGFPGGYMKDVEQWLSPEDFIHLVSTKDDKRISFTETIVYRDAKTMKIFSQQYWGTITDHPRGKGSTIEQIAEFAGRTIAECHNQGAFSHNPKDYIWYQFAKWFSELS
jgi:XTP/dITP diphosphohydrolase